MIELKHNNVKFQIDFPILFFLFFRFFFFFFNRYFTPTVFDTIFLSRRLFFCIEGKTAWICGLRLYTDPVENKKVFKMLGQQPSACESLS